MLQSNKRHFSLTIDQFTMQDYKLLLILPQTGLLIKELYLF